MTFDKGCKVSLKKGKDGLEKGQELHIYDHKNNTTYLRITSEWKEFHFWGQSSLFHFVALCGWFQKNLNMWIYSVGGKKVDMEALNQFIKTCCVNPRREIWSEPLWLTANEESQARKHNSRLESLDLYVESAGKSAAPVIRHGPLCTLFLFIFFFFFLNNWSNSHQSSSH